MNLDKLNELFENGQVVDAQALVDVGYVTKIAPYGLKVLGNGSLEKALTVKASKFSASAESAIKAAGGVVEVL